MPAMDTIVALSTPAGESAVAMIRLSGPACPEIATAILSQKGELKPRHAYFVNYKSLAGKSIDDCVLTFFESGKSFTGDAMLEIVPHGNPLIVQLILEDLIARGCRPSEPGEFTRTAFLNGQMDLTQAEAVADIIHARSEQSLQLANKQLHGSIGRKMSSLTEELLQIMAHLEAYIDFPEEDLPSEDQAGPAQSLRILIQSLKELIETQRYAALLHEGVKTLIVGEPNVGKSSLINALTGTDRAIVSATPGTTRDYLAAFIMVGPWRIEVLDTAGLHEAGDDLERVGIQHTMEQAETADFFLLVVDATRPTPELPKVLLERMHPENTLVLHNKMDLDSVSSAKDFMPSLPHCEISAKQGDGIEAMRQTWLKVLEAKTAPLRTLDGIIVNTRHATALGVAVCALESASEKFRTGDLSELIAADLRDAVDAIGDVVGRVDNERMLDSLFKQFCIGK